MKGFCLIILFSSLLYLPARSQQKGDSTTRTDTARSKPIRPDLLRKIPQPVGWVNDYAFLFSNEETRLLDSLITDYEKKTTIEIAVVTLDSTRTNARDFDEFTMLIGNTWGVGKEETHNGILIAISADLRRMRVHNGFGIEKIISNEETKVIVDTVFIPLFQQGKLYEGTRKGIIALMEKIASRQ